MARHFDVHSIVGLPMYFAIGVHVHVLDDKFAICVITFEVLPITGASRSDGKKSCESASVEDGHIEQMQFIEKYFGDNTVVLRFDFYFKIEALWTTQL